MDIKIMNQLEAAIVGNADYALEAIEDAILKIKNQINKNLLPRIKELVIEIADNNYDHLHDLKRLVMGNTPEASGSDNDIFLMDVKGGNIIHTLRMHLNAVIESVEKYNESII